MHVNVYAVVIVARALIKSPSYTTAVLNSSLVYWIYCDLLRFTALR